MKKRDAFIQKFSKSGARLEKRSATRLARQVNDGNGERLGVDRGHATSTDKKKILPPSRLPGKDSSRRRSISAPDDGRRHGLKPMRRVRYLFIIKAILKDSKVVVCWIVKAFARTSASSS
jgi:hypothetical protein